MPLPALEAVAPRWRWILPVVALVGLVHVSGVGLTLDRAFFDAASRRPWRAPPLDPAASALVLIDEHTMAEAKREGYGVRWPFPRAAFAALIAALDRAGAARIVVDFTFLEPSDAAEQDALLASIAAAAHGTILARASERNPVFWDESFVGNHPAFFAYPRTGDADLVADEDGTARRYHAPGSLAAAALDSPAVVETGLLRWHGGLAQIRAQGVPVLSAARFFNPGLHLLNQLIEAAPEADPTVLASALAAEAELTGGEFDAVRGRTVFVGANAAGTFDVKPMPVGRIEPGVLIHWTAWTNLRANGFIRPVADWVVLSLAAGAVVILGAFGVKRGRIWPSVAVAVGLIAGMLGGAYVALSAGWLLAPATPVAAALLALTGVAAEGVWTEHRRRQEVQAMFGSYVDPGVVERLVRDPASIRLAGEKREATVFFCDLAGFTDLSEQVAPETLLTLINTYLEETSDCLLHHGAYIDKYIGDAVMAVFGAPQARADHAYAAGCAALAAQQVLARMNARLAPQFGRTLHMRIGLNSGEMIVGNLGSARKRNYTVLGDTVNLASRLEGANKEFGTTILLGEETARQIGERLVHRPLSRLRVKGRQRAVEVSELIGRSEELTPERREFVRLYRTGYQRFAEREFAAASEALNAALALAPDDAITQTLLKEAQRLAETPPPADWEPVLTLTSK